MMVFASLMAALIAVGSYLAVPVGPVPIVLQNLFVLLAGLLLGGRWAAASVAVFLLAGACGLPVFANGTAGLGRLIGPTGGYLIGYLAAAFLVGIMAEKANQRVALEVLAMVIGSMVVYAFGVPWLAMVTGMPWDKAIAVGLYPFLIGDALKIAAAIPISRAVRPLMRSMPGIVVAPIKRERA
jgi:biotin transport system substrate-specific component